MYSTSSRGQPTRGGPPAWVLRKRLTTYGKNFIRYKMLMPYVLVYHAAWILSKKLFYTGVEIKELHTDLR